MNPQNDPLTPENLPPTPPSPSPEPPQPPAPQASEPPTPPTPPEPPKPPIASPTPSNTGFPETPADPAVVSSGFGTPDVPPELAVTPSPSQKRRFKWPVIVGIIVLALIAGYAAYYFGYKTNPSVIYSQSLKNTAKGYDKLVNYVNDQSKADYKGSTGTGSFSSKSSSFSTDGQMTFNTNGGNAEGSFNVGLGATRLTINGRFISSSSGNPDIYLQASGIKGLGGMLGSADLDAKLAKLDSSWIVIDHTLLDNLSKDQTNGTAVTKLKPPTREQVLSAAQAFGKVNQEYLFSTNKDKAVLKIVKKYGLETVQGHKTYHYQVGIQQANLKKYISAQQAALQSSQLQSWIKANNYTSDVNDFFKGMIDSTSSVKSSDTFGMWSDIDTRMVYKVRFDQSTDSSVRGYLDVGLNYKGGDTFPFFIAAQTEDNADKASATNYNLTATLNSKTNVVNLKLNVQSGNATDASTTTASFTYKPTNQPATIVAPANAKSLSQVMSELGYGNLLNELQTQVSQ